MKASAAVKMNMGEFMREHKHLLGVLRRPTSAKLKAEAEKQGREVRERS